MNQEKAFLDIGELLQKANALQVATWPESDVVAITERTFRYWVKEGLIERRGSRGAGVKYPESLVNRLLFIRMLQKKSALSLENIRTTIGSVDEETIRRVVMLEERLDLVNEIDPDSARSRLEAGEQMVPLAVDAPTQSKQRNRVRPEPPRGRGAIDLTRRQGEVMDQLRRIEDRIDAQEAFFHQGFMDAQNRIQTSNYDLQHSLEDVVNRVAEQTQRTSNELREELRLARNEYRYLHERVDHLSTQYEATGKEILDLSMRFDSLANRLVTFISESPANSDDKGN